MSESDEEWRKRVGYPDWEKEKREMDGAWQMKMEHLKAKQKEREEKRNATTGDESEADEVEESAEPPRG